jgi:hypothetical protein
MKRKNKNEEEEKANERERQENPTRDVVLFTCPGFGRFVSLTRAGGNP